MAMLAQQMQLANAMMPGAPLQPVVRARGFPWGLGSVQAAQAASPGKSHKGQEWERNQLH